MNDTLVRGEIHFADCPPLSAGATAYARLLDTSCADGTSRVVCERVVKGVDAAANAGKPVPFTLEGKTENRTASYCVQVFVDLDGDGKLSPGDLLSVESYPVLTHGFPNFAQVTVRPIR